MRGSELFETKSSYIGSFNNLDMDGFGIYTYPDGTEYYGQFKNGDFDGYGTIITKSNIRISGYFVKGKCEKFSIEFSDGLKYDQDEWKYLGASDRRYLAEIKRGILPVGYSFITKNRWRPNMPKGFYDVGEGYFNPKNGAIYCMKTDNYIRNVSKAEWNWILENCYRDEPSNVGYKESLVQNNINLMKEVNDILCCCENDDEMPLEYL